MDTKYLRKAGLTDGEIRVYLALLGLGVSTIGPILGKSRVTKSIIYRILDQLIDKGIVSYIIKDKTKHFQAEQPQKLIAYVEKKEEELEETKKKIEAMLPELLLQQQSAKKSEATIYQGFKGIMTVHDKRFEKLKKGDEYFFFGLPPKQPKYYHAYWQKDHKKRAKEGIKCKMLYNYKVEEQTLQDRNSFTLCDARRMPIDVDTPAWILGYKDVTVIGIPLAKKPFAFEIINQEVADSFTAYFSWFWKQSKQYRCT
jgi:DNA-binding MarR family transcriptional regulator